MMVVWRSSRSTKLIYVGPG